jgi:hypothetical protein
VLYRKREWARRAHEHKWGTRKSDRPSSLGRPSHRSRNSQLSSSVQTLRHRRAKSLVFKVTWVNSKIFQRVLWPPTTMEWNSGSATKASSVPHFHRIRAFGLRTEFSLPSAKDYEIKSLRISQDERTFSPYILKKSRSWTPVGPHPKKEESGTSSQVVIN